MTAVGRDRSPAETKWTHFSMKWLKGKRRGCGLLPNTIPTAALKFPNGTFKIKANNPFLFCVLKISFYMPIIKVYYNVDKTKYVITGIKGDTQIVVLCVVCQAPTTHAFTQGQITWTGWGFVYCFILQAPSAWFLFNICSFTSCFCVTSMIRTSQYNYIFVQML